ncbi:uncharacterized protein LOC112201349 [Rosa chinensis]|uniref:uncharacterized protein LOC112201349 n=1 Tax=Rosa chinensis TaxID=74649 RepID=UPI000D09085C|nr:uncharacterized protein LOC112201349 [Rosa chinensis]
MDQLNDCSMVAILLCLVVAASVLFLPLIMGPLHPPSYPILLVIPIVLVLAIIFLHQASK